MAMCHIILNTDENENERFRPLRNAFNYVFHAVSTGEVVSMLTKWQGINTRSLLHQSHRAVIKHSTEAMMQVFFITFNGTEEEEKKYNFLIW